MCKGVHPPSGSSSCVYTSQFAPKGSGGNLVTGCENKARSGTKVALAALGCVTKVVVQLMYDMKVYKVQYQCTGGGGRVSKIEAGYETEWLLSQEHKFYIAVLHMCLEPESEKETI